MMSQLYELIQKSAETRFWLHVLSKSSVPLIAFSGAVYTALQFQRAKRWRAGDLAQELLSDLSVDDELAFACQAIDWGIGPLIVPARHRPIMWTIAVDPAHPTPRELGEVIDHDVKIMAAALQVQLPPASLNNPLYLVYRYSFDKLFTHLSYVNTLIERKQIAVADLEGFKYWLIRIAVYEYPPYPMTGEQMFQRFLTYPYFLYSGVAELGKKLGVKGWSDTRIDDVPGF